jgi:hypothetical protein
VAATTLTTYCLDVLCQANDALFEQGHKCVVYFCCFWGGILNNLVTIHGNTYELEVKTQIQQSCYEQIRSKHTRNDISHKIVSID